ncbi:MAG TPA: response regulator, partial [Polyangiales bacterium]
MPKRRGIQDDEALLEAELEAQAAMEFPGSDVPVAQVLVIDDSALNRNSIVRLLKSAGFTVISTDSAIGATRLVLRSGASVVVADLNM